MESIGTWLRRERELRNIDLVEVADRTRIPLQQLERLEDDRFAELPGEVFVKGYLRAYARAVGLSGEEVLGRFANNMRSRDVMPAPAMPTAPVQERGGRFGLAIALVVFAVLATMAMSFLLRPRTNERPEQLSNNSVTVESAPTSAQV
ncbi:MAG: helix-turn-helix transcriptional regulator [Polyangiales bacterium]